MQNRGLELTALGVQDSTAQAAALSQQHQQGAEELLSPVFI